MHTVAPENGAKSVKQNFLSRVFRGVLVVAVVALLATVVTPSPQSASAEVTVSGDPQQLAQTLVGFKDAGVLTFACSLDGPGQVACVGGNDAAYQKSIVPLAETGSVTPNCAVDVRILQLMVLTVQNFGSMRVNELNRPCIGSSLNCPSSVHCSDPAKAIDIGLVGGQSVGNSGARTHELLNFLDGVVPSNTVAGQVGCHPSWPLSNIAYIADSCGHQHIDFSRTSAPMRVTTSGPTALPGGTVIQAVASPTTGWQTLPTSQSVSSGQISTVNMGGNWPQIWVNEGGNLVEIWGDSAGWHKVPTGIQINAASTISAIRVANEPNARIYINEGGTLLEAYGDSTGWHVGNTGLQIGTGQISATYLSGGWGRIMVNENGVLMEVSADNNGWHKGNTGVQIGNAYISAVNMGNNRLQIMANDGGTLFQISPYGGAWHKDSTGLSIGSGYISAVNMDGTWPQVAINGGGTLLFAVGTSSGWVLQSTGKQIGPGLVPAVNMRPGVTTNNWPSVITLQ
ncbi:hypothetical protein [Agreia sp. Leaf210]|uniref:hypothetical protein n=1 Tax=Agreia sp. Leaf210 TaxID=1735682 RepID=UPI000A7FD195|nr:hypothetical protein [Agreia sp. Leaf210]